LAAGILIKGLTPVIAALTIITLSLADRNVTWLKQLRPLPGLLLVIVLSASWLAPISYYSHSNFLFDMVQGDLMPKVMGGQQSHGMPPGYFMLLFPLMFWPASVFFWQGAMAGLSRWQEPAWRFLLCWAIPTWIFFEFIPTKLPEYVLPAYPAVAILIAGSLLIALPTKVDNSQVSPALANKRLAKTMWRGYLALYYGIWFLYSLFLAGFMIILPHYVDHIWQPWTFLSAGIISLSSCWALICIWHKKFMRALKILIVAAILSFAPFFQIVLPNLKNFWLSEKIAQTINRSCTNCVNDSRPLLAIGYGEPSLVFILGTHKVKYSDLIAMEADLQGSNSTDRLMLVDQVFYAQLQQILSKQGWVISELASVRGFNYSNSKWTTLFLVQVKKA
jgi:4-amino-4-deoxy-L-arabinose transferase-like glycosyltransferase